MKVLWAIILSTFREAVRDKVLHGILFFAVALILFSIVLGKLSLGEEFRVIMDVGLAGTSFFGVVTAIFLGSTLVYKEVEKKTIYTVLARPLTRLLFLTGKYLGLLLTLLVLVAGLTAVLILILAVNGGTPQPGFYLMVLMICMEIALIASVSLFFTSFSTPFLSGLLTFGVFIIGRNLDIAIAYASSPKAGILGPIISTVARVMPRFYLFYPTGRMVESSWSSIHEVFVESQYIASALGYGILYTMFFFSVAALVLWRRNFV